MWKLLVILVVIKLYALIDMFNNIDYSATFLLILQNFLINSIGVCFFFHFQEYFYVTHDLIVDIFVFLLSKDFDIFQDIYIF